MKNENKMMVMGWLSKWNDSDLDELRSLIIAETCAREHKRKQERELWIENHYTQFHCCSGDYKIVGNTVVIALAWMGNIKMATATAVKGDKFDLRTGVAVAYAKACGERIPDFV
jgi:hypothetical protein